MGWKEITPEFIQFQEKGEAIEGILLGYDEITVKGVTVKRWQMERSGDGVILSFLGGVSLDRILEAVPRGKLIRLEYQGRINIGSGMSVKKFKLYEQVEDDVTGVTEATSKSRTRK